MAQDLPSPKDFLRARRPERFSDSTASDVPVLDRGRLEYHLATITTRKQEYDFEQFARAIAQREVCPNITIQTGPTGGGDGKVDAETYPVADALSLTWYAGIGREADAERWAFAFSAKEDWRAKLRSDIGKIAETKRGYAKAFFVTSQAVPSRLQAEVQDELTQKHGIDVRVLDREWILDRVFTNRRESLAIEELGIAPDIHEQVRQGPNDFRRKAGLDALEATIRERSEEGRTGPGLAEDCLQAAILSTQLERPVIETDGRFDRADRVAGEHGTDHQRFKVAYHRAWTSYWWREDVPLFVELYDQAEERAAGTCNPHELELMTNLWLLLHTAFATGQADIEPAHMEERTERLVQQLTAVASDEQFVTAALQARTHLAFLGLHEALRRQEDVDPMLTELEAVIHASAGLAGYPLAPLCEIIMEMGRLQGGEVYDRLFELATATMASRNQETTAARMLLERGEQCIEANKPYDAIRYLGRSLGGLYKDETRDDEIRALYGCACAYEQVGLLWAARGTLLVAASLSTSELVRHEEVTPELAICCRRMKWLELQLGRVTQTLEWHRVDCAVRSMLADRGYDEAQLLDGEDEFDLALGGLLLKSDAAELEQMSRLPGVLLELDLQASRAALMFALGYEHEARAILELPEVRDTLEFFRSWLHRVNAEDLPEHPLLGEGAVVPLTSCVLGCQVSVGADNAAPYLYLAESLLAAIESALATCAERHVFAIEPALQISVQACESAGALFEPEFLNDDGRPVLLIHCREFDPHTLDAESQCAVRDRLLLVLAGVMGRVLAIGQPKPFLDELISEERALDRALSFTGSFVVLGNVLGYQPMARVSDWFGEEHKRYDLIRDRTWDAAVDAKVAAPATREPRAQVAADKGITGHNKMRTKSLIRISLWDRAKWVATGYFWDSANSFPPVMAVVFQDGAAGDAIFERLREEVGDEDHANLLRISVIRGIDREHPHWYRVVLGTNVDAAELGRDEMALFVSRVNQMEPANGSNLDHFLRRFNAAGCYSLAPAVSGDPSAGFELLWGPQIVKYHLHVYEAWQVGRHDLEAAAINPDDKVVIPSEETDAPIIELQAWLRDQ